VARSTGNAFDLRGPSSFAADSRFAANRKGLSKSQRATLTVEQRKSEQGWCPGLIWGLSAKADQQVRAPKKRG
jgi:hypothetical protein